jgi:hypothetical protein
VKKTKIHISLFLLLVAVTYSINIHGLSHTFEDHHTDNDNTTCELCIINHKKDQSFFALEPHSDFIEFIAYNQFEDVCREIISAQIEIPSHYFLGQFFNRPPPSYI